MLTTAYDEWNRVIGVTHPDGSTALTSYSGNRATVADEAGKKKEMVSDVLGRLRSVREDPDGLDEVTSYSYDALNNLTQVVQGAQTRTFEYDSLGRLRRATNPEVGVPVAYEYDGNGNLAQKTVGGVVSTMSYDNLNRLWRKSYTDGTPAVTLCYDGQGMGGSGCEGSSQEGAGLRLTETHTSVSGTRYAYDTLGRVSGNEQRTAGLAPAAVFHYQYNADDSVASERYPSGQVVTTCYDSLGRVKWVSGASETLDCSSAEGPAGSYVTGVSYTHTAEGEQIGTALGNGLTELHKRNRRGQVREVSLGTLWRLENHYGTANNGNVVKQVVGVPGMMTVTERYEYDGVNRLKTAAEYATDRVAAQCPDSGSVWCQGWGYDRWGNGKVVASQNVPGGVGPVEYAGNNRIVGWGYERGNLVRDGLGQEFGYDAEERQKEAGTARYYYDGEGRRVKKEAGGRTTVYVYDGFGRLGAEYGEGPASGRRYLTGDHLGTVRVMTDQAGVVQERHDYLPYGEEILATAGDQRLNVPGYGGTSEVTQRFTGKERDGETGLDYFGARYFSGAQGRFTSPDPLMASANVADPQSWNRYVYARNNPLKYVDPLGLYASPTFNCADGDSACLNDDQRRILNASTIEIEGKKYSGEALYNKMNEKQQNAFVNITDKLGSIQLEGGGTALAQVQSITGDARPGREGIADDRLFANVSSSLESTIQGMNGFASAPGHGPFSNSFKSTDGPLGNIQMSFQGTYADIDIDIGNIKASNPGAAILGGIVHAGEVLQNSIFRTTTNQDVVRRILIANPKIGITPSPDARFNRK